MRETAPAHYWARSVNAFYTAYVLSKTSEKRARGFADQVGYGGTPRVALQEAFIREAAIALELIIKAILADQLPEGQRIPKNHNLPLLWEQAKLRKPSAVDMYHLNYLAIVLKWSGRYPVAAGRAKYDADLREHDRLLKKANGQETSLVITTRPTRWNEFSTLYEIASQAFSEHYDKA